MTSRAQAIIEALDKVDQSVSGIDERIEAVAQILEKSNGEHATAVRESIDRLSEANVYASETIYNGQIMAAENLGRALKESSKEVKDGLIIIAGLYLYSTAMGHARKRSLENRQFVQMFDSVVALFDRHGSTLSYNFVLKHSYAENTTTDERRTLLNGLIHYGIVKDNYGEKSNKLYLDSTSPHILNIYNYLEERGLIVYQGE